MPVGIVIVMPDALVQDKNRPACADASVMLAEMLTTAADACDAVTLVSASSDATPFAAPFALVGMYECV